MRSGLFCYHCSQNFVRRLASLKLRSHVAEAALANGARSGRDLPEWPNSFGRVGSEEFFSKKNICAQKTLLLADCLQTFIIERMIPLEAAIVY